MRIHPIYNVCTYIQIHVTYIYTNLEYTSKGPVERFAVHIAPLLYTYIKTYIYNKLYNIQHASIYTFYDICL